MKLSCSLFACLLVGCAASEADLETTDQAVAVDATAGDQAALRERLARTHLTFTKDVVLQNTSGGQSAAVGTYYRYRDGSIKCWVVSKDPRALLIAKVVSGSTYAFGPVEVGRHQAWNGYGEFQALSFSADLLNDQVSGGERGGPSGLSFSCSGTVFPTVSRLDAALEKPDDDATKSVAVLRDAPAYR